MKQTEPRLPRISNDHWSIPAEDSPLIAQAQAQKYLGIGRTSFEKYIRPRLTEIKIGRRIFFNKVDLENFVDRMGGANRVSSWRWKR